MRTDESFGPADLDRLLASRERTAEDDGDSGVEHSISPSDLQPRHLIAAMTMTDQTDPSGQVFDWESVLDVVGELPGEEEAEWLTGVVRRFGGFHSTSSSTVSGIRALGDHVYEMRHTYPHVYVTYLHELHSLLRSSASSEVMETAESRFQHFATKGDAVSSERVREFYERDVSDRLVNPTVGKNSRLSTLQSLSSRSIDEVDSGIPMQLLFPLRNDYDADIEREALRVIEEWARTFETSTVSQSTIETLEPLLEGDQEELPPRLVTELIVSRYLAPEVVDWLTQLPKVEERQEVVRAAFEALEPVAGLRDCGEELCQFLLERSHDEETMSAGIDLLKSIQVGIAPHHRTDDPAQDDHIRQERFIEAELAVDRTIRRTLQAIAEDDTEPDSVRAHAMRVWLSARPPELHEQFWDISPSDVGEDPVTDAKLEVAADQHLVEVVAKIEELWAGGSDDPDRLSSLTNVLSELGVREIVSLLLEPAFDHDDSSIREQAQEALLDNEYEAEIDRESTRRSIVERIGDRFEAARAASDLEEDVRQRKTERLSKETDRQDARVTASRTTSRSADVLVSFRARGTEFMLRLAPLFDRLEELADQIDTLERQQSELQSEIQQQRDEAQRLVDEIESVESDIENTENEIDRAQSELQACENEISDLDSQIATAERERDRIENNPPRQQGIGEEARKKYERELEDWKRKRDEARRAVESLKDEQRQNRQRFRELQNEIDSLQQQLRQLQNKHDRLSQELDASKRRREEHVNRLAEVESRLDELQQARQECQRQIDDIVGKLDGVRDEARTKREQLLDRQREASSEASRLRGEAKQLVREQSNAISEQRKRKERVGQLKEQIDDDQKTFQEDGSRTRDESIEADETAIEASIRRYLDHNDENVQHWRLDSAVRRVVEAEPFEEAESEHVERARTWKEDQ